MTVVIGVKARNGAVLVADAHPMKKIEGGNFPDIMSPDPIRKSGAYIAWSGPFRDDSFLTYFKLDVCERLNEARNLTHPVALAQDKDQLTEEDPLYVAHAIPGFLRALGLRTTILRFFSDAPPDLLYLQDGCVASIRAAHSHGLGAQHALPLLPFTTASDVNEALLIAIDALNAALDKSSERTCIFKGYHLVTVEYTGEANVVRTAYDCDAKRIGRGSLKFLGPWFH